MIRVRCFNANNINKCDFIAIINDNKVLKSSKGMLIFDAEKGIYSICVYHQKKVLIYNDEDINVDFIFGLYKAPVIKRIFYLTDSNYLGLKIREGIIILNGL